MVGIGFIAGLVIRNADDMGAVAARTQWGLLALSLALAVAANFATSALFRHLLAKYGAPVPPSHGHRIFFYAQFAKYIPGKVWALVYQASHLGGTALLSVLFFANLDLLFVSVVVNLLVAAGLLVLASQPLLSLAALALSLAAAHLAARSCLVLRMLRRLSGRIGWVDRRLPECLAPEPHAVPIVYGLAMWLGYALASALLLKATLGFSLIDALACFAILNLASIAGTLAFLFPAGMGVRELIFILLGSQLPQLGDSGTLAAIAVAFRLWQVAHDILGATLVRLFMPASD